MRCVVDTVLVVIPEVVYVVVVALLVVDLFVIFPSECVARTTYAGKLVVTLLTVVSLGVVAVAVGGVCVSMWGGTVLRSPSVKAYIVLIYIVLPTMTSMTYYMQTTPLSSPRII